VVASRKYRAPPLPNTASQYGVPVTTEIPGIVTTFHAPAFTEPSDPDESLTPGCPPLSEYKPTSNLVALLCESTNTETDEAEPATSPTNGNASANPGRFESTPASIDWSPNNTGSEAGKATTGAALTPYVRCRWAPFRRPATTRP
jgi:hypothetical protein